MANNTSSIASLRKMFYETHELISTAHHEAGHAIYGLLHFMKVSEVSVIKGKKSKRIEGLTSYDHPKNFSDIIDSVLLNERVISEICMSYSGLVAEKKYFKIISGSDEFPMFLKSGSYNDICSASFMFNKYNLVEPGKKRYVFKQNLIRQINKELQEHWDAVTLVSHFLFKKKKITYIELQNLLIKKTNHKQFWKSQFKLINNYYDNQSNIDEKELKIRLFI